MPSFRTIVKKIIPTKLFRKIEPFGHMLESILFNIVYGFSARGLHVIGVTGTNGKTTTTFLIAKMLHEAGYKVAFLSTVAYGLPNNIQLQTKHVTTAQASILQKRLREFKQAGVKWVVLETSSHALAQNRVWGVPYEIAVMTNVTRDHLDYHGNFDNYLAAKLRLFKIAARHGQRFGVVNADDPNCQKFVDSVPTATTYGLRKGDLQVRSLRSSVGGSSYRAVSGKDSYDIKINIPGLFNVSNSLAAVAVGQRLGLSKKQIERGIASLKSVEGRMTVVDEGQPFRVIVDFASTPDAFERLFDSLRPVTKGKLIAVFGSAGRRDEAKRTMQGEIAGHAADEVILTEEDDRDENGNQILDQIAEGATKAGKVLDKNLFKILDRRKAIEFALGRAHKAGDTVVLLGKGHEKTIERADGEHSWDEIEIAKKLLRRANRSK